MALVTTEIAPEVNLKKKLTNKSQPSRHKLLTLILLTWTIWRAPFKASKWRVGFNSAFKGLNRITDSNEMFMFIL
jgi:hypothetical protein